MSSQANIDKIIQIISDNNFLFGLEESSFLNILKQAQANVSETFVNLEEQDNSNKNFYKYAFNLVNTEFDTFIKSIEDIRSSYLPSNVYETITSTINNPDGLSAITEQVANESTPLESYQNAFFRMLGLPSWEDVIADTDGITLSIINISGELEDNKVNSENIYNSYLDTRQAFSTIGCNTGVTHFDLINVNVSSADFLKKQKNFSEEAIAEIQTFSKILSALIDADQANTETLNTLKDQYNSYKNQLLSKSINNGENLYSKVNKIYKENPNGGDPLSWYDLTPEEFYDVVEATFLTNYTGYLLFIYYAYIGKDSINFLNKSEIDKLYKDLIKNEPTDESLNNIEKNIYSYSSLLFPLVKDGRISKCINDPSKIVADPFLPITKRIVNGNYLKSSLLESIIRIRTDVISGTKAYNDEVPYLIGEDKDKEIFQTSVSGELLGYLESLLIIRMLDTLEALAEGTKRNIEQISVTQRRTGKGLFGSCYDPKSSALAAVPVVDKKLSKERVILNNYALIEDSIMLLLGTKDSEQDSLNLQTDINRNSSIPDSYLMSSLVNLVQVPRKYINQRVEQEDRKAKTENSVGSKVAKDLEVVIGIRSGVGIVDLIAIIIAMLTIEEKYLVALMTKSQIDMMYLQVNPDTFDNERKRQISEIPIAEAVNVLTERVYTVYKLFVELLKN